jgi:hypothetical protein
MEIAGVRSLAMFPFAEIQRVMKYSARRLIGSRLYESFG